MTNALMNIRKKMKMRVLVNSVSIKRLITFLLCISAITSIIHAHGEDLDEETGSVWHSLNLPDPLEILYSGSAIALVSIIISLIYEKKLDNLQKKVLFLLIAVSIIIPTIYLAATTIYLNLVSETGGPVHWHADYEVWACGEKYELLDPIGIENRIGSPVFHEHNDNRIHAEGVLLTKSDASLERFFTETGGKISKTELTMSTNEGLKTWKNDGLCNGKKAELQIFVYSVVNAHPDQKTGFLYEQKKLEDFEEYVLSPYSLIPPGDCIIIEFGETKNKTDKICATYQSSIEKGDMKEAENGS